MRSMSTSPNISFIAGSSSTRALSPVEVVHAATAVDQSSLSARCNSGLEPSNTLLFEEP